MTEINYENLVNDYYQNLNSNLRNFKGGPDFLETWAHDEDHNRSIQEILHLAIEHDINRLSLILNEKICSVLDMKKIKELFSNNRNIELNNHTLRMAKLNE